MADQDIWNEALDAKLAYEDEIQNHNTRLLLGLENVKSEDFESLIDGVEIRWKMQIVKEPQGDKQHEKYDSFPCVFIDQWSVGTEGDSFEGTIFAQLEENKWLSIPFNI